MSTTKGWNDSSLHDWVTHIYPPDADGHFRPVINFFKKSWQTARDEAAVLVTLCGSCHCECFTCSSLSITHQGTYRQKTPSQMSTVYNNNTCIKIPALKYIHKKSTFENTNQNIKSMCYISEIIFISAILHIITVTCYQQIHVYSGLFAKIYYWKCKPN